MLRRKGGVASFQLQVCKRPAHRLAQAGSNAWTEASAGRSPLGACCGGCTSLAAIATWDTLVGCCQEIAVKAAVQRAWHSPGGINAGWVSDGGGTLSLWVRGSSAAACCAVPCSPGCALSLWVCIQAVVRKLHRNLECKTCALEVVGSASNRGRVRQGMSQAGSQPRAILPCHKAGASDHLLMWQLPSTLRTCRHFCCCVT